MAREVLLGVVIARAPLVILANAHAAEEQFLCGEVTDV